MVEVIVSEMRSRRETSMIHEGYVIIVNVRGCLSAERSYANIMRKEGIQFKIIMVIK
jgi:hypothetical protein